MNSPLGLGLRHPLHPVRPGLILEAAVDLIAADQDDNLLEATANPEGIAAHHFDPPAFALGVTAVHLVEIADEKGRLVAAGAGPDFQEGVLLVVGIPGQQGQTHLLLKLGQASGQLLDLDANQLTHLLVAFILQQVPVFPQGTFGARVISIELMHPGHLGMLLGQSAESILIGHEGRIGKLMLKFIELVGQVGESFEHISHI